MAEILQTKDEQGPTEKMVSKKPEEEKSKIAEQTNEEKEPLENGNIKKNDEDEGESSEEELGSLEKPVEILSRKRERKSTERFTLNTPEAKTHPEDELDFTKGPGVKLGDIPFVNYSLNKEVAEDLKTLHKILYPRMCKVNMLKKNIRAFCGFPFDKDTAHYKKVEGIANRLFSTGLKYILGVLGLEKKGDKEQMKERLLEFLVKPEDLGRKLPEKKRKKSTSKEKKKKSKVAKSSRPKEKHDQYVSSASDSDSDDEDEKEDGNDEEEKEAAKSKTPKKKSESPKKKPGSEKKPAKPKSNADSEKKKDAKKKKPTAVKIPVPKKKKSIEKKADTKRKADDDSEDDEPLVKKSKNEPTDSEIKTVVSDILKDADLEEITMKTVCRQVYDHFPDFDLTPRKDFIKNTVKEGPGVKLGDIPFVNYSLNKEVAEDLKTLHKILYPRMCKVNMLKKNIRAFCGFPFDKDTAHYKKVEGIANRLFSTGLKYILGVLGLEKKGDKEQMKERLLEFLVKPEDLGRKLPEKKRKKSTSKEKKKKSKVAKSSRPKEKHDQYVSSASDSDSDDEDEKEDGNDEEEKEAAKSKTPKKKSESPKKKPGSEKKPAKPKSNADSEKKKDAKKKKPTAVKIPVPKKKKSIEKKADTKRKADDDSEDDEPLVKKSKNEPTDSEIKTVVSDILKDADLEEITMKTVCRQVYDHFPDFDLTPRKDFIKNTVKEIIS